MTRSFTETLFRSFRLSLAAVFCVATLASAQAEKKYRVYLGTYTGEVSKGVKTPRNFAIDPTGQYKLVANQSGGNVIVFRIDQSTGELTPTGASLQVPSPVCVRFMDISA